MKSRLGTRLLTKARLLKLWREWGRPLLIIFAVLGSVRSTVADWYDVPTGSMKPTIVEGDRIFVNKLAYDLKVPFTPWRVAEWGGPERGEVVVLRSPADGQRLVKRVIAVPGDRVAMLENRLLINGQPLLYSPFDPPPDGLDANAPNGRRFASESIGRHTHPIMITPGLPTARSFGPLTVPQGCYFVMGDNRDVSLDSRRFGFVDGDRIIGRAVGVVMSLDRSRYYLPRWHRFFRVLP